MSRLLRRRTRERCWPDVPGGGFEFAGEPLWKATGGSISGLNQAWAIIVGTMALPITTVTRIEYWYWVM